MRMMKVVKEEKTSVVNEYDTMDRKQKLNMKDLMIDEEYIKMNKELKLN